MAGLLGELAVNPAEAMFVDSDSLRDHLEAAHVGGDITIALDLSPDVTAALIRARQILSTLLDAEADISATISALLFSYLVRRTVAATRATLAAAEASGKQQLGGSRDNVVSLTERIIE